MRTGIFTKAVRRSLTFAFLFAVAGGQIAQAQATRAAAPSKAVKVTSVEGIDEYTLPNGLHVLLFPDQSKPTTTVNVTYLVGSRHEGAGETGMAHLLEHLMFKGSAHHKNVAQELTEHGSRPNGTTWYDRTNYFEIVPTSDVNVDWALDMEADRMVNSFIARKDLESEFSVVRNELESGENSPFRVTLERMLATAYLWHGYGRSTIGTRADIENVPIERLQAFYKKYYQPDNAVLVVAGKFEPAKMLALVEKKFGAIPRPQRSFAAGNLLFPTYTVEPAQDGEREVTIRRTGDAQLMMVGYHIPSGSHADYAAVDVLANVLGTNPSGRIYKALVDTKLASSVGVGSFQFREPGMLYVQVQMRMTQSLDSARGALERALDASATTTFTAEEVDRAKTTLLKNIDLSLANSDEIGLDLSEWAAMGDWRLFFLHRDRIAKVTPADVHRVAAAYLKPSNRTVAMFVPTKQPDRAEIPAIPNVKALVADYKGHEVVQAGETFDASPKNIDTRTAHSKLANGMNVALLPKLTRANKVVAQITLRLGTVPTLNGKFMTASFASGLLMRGTTQLDRQQVKDSLDKLKARVFIGGATNSAVASIETTRENLIPTLELTAQILRSPRFDADEFEKLRRERLAGLESFKSDPGFLANVALNKKLLPVPRGNPLYTSSAEEQAEDINAVTLDSVKAFHKNFYGASYADFAAVGDFDAAAVKKTVERLFGDWKNPQPFERAARTYIPLDSSSTKIETPDKANAVFWVGQNIELRDDDPDYPAMVLANFMLGGGFLNSRLATRIRQKEGISYGVSSGFSAQSLDRTANLFVNAIYAPQNVDRLVAAFREEIAKVRTDGFTQQEIDTAKPGYLQARSQGRANDDELIGTLISRRFAGRTLAWDEDFERKVQALTPSQINAAVKKYIDPAKMVVVRAGDFAKNPPAKPVP